MAPPWFIPAKGRSAHDAGAVEQEKCTTLYGVPTMFIAELEHPEFARFDLTSLRPESWPARHADRSDAPSDRQDEHARCHNRLWHDRDQPGQFQTGVATRSNGAWRQSPHSPAQPK